ncbi:MAG TPA: Maf family protein [Steroidobacteraceae bacterium]
MRTLLLASTSPYRRALLERLGLPFEVTAPQVLEHAIPGEPPQLRAVRLAQAKADAVAQRHPHALVIGSDQVAALGTRVLHKPGDALHCREQLAALSGSTAHFHTACALVGERARISVSYLDTTSVVFRSLSAEEIERYVEREQPFDCAGSFKAEALGISLFTRIDSSDPTALVGLPLIWLASALRNCGYSLP